MRSDLLHIVTPVFNPIRWDSRLRLAREAIASWVDEGAHVVLVECAYGERPHQLADLADLSTVTHVPVRARTLAWNKENLQDIGIAHLPPSAKYIGTFDADIRFRKRGWAAEIVHALQMYPVIQPWGDCYDLGPDDEHLDLHRSFCRLVHERKPIVQGPNAKNGPYCFGHPGYAWAWTRQALEWLGGLIDTAVLGAADHHMAMALIGRVGESIPDILGDGYAAPLRTWQRRAAAHIAGRLGYLPGTIEHPFHGSKRRRGYIDRWNILYKHGFDAAVDLKYNTYGVIELAGNKPELEHDIDLYHRSRQEDGNLAD